MSGRGFVFKVVVIGDGAVGKTSLIQQYTHGEFDKSYIPTLGAQFTKHSKEVDGNPVDLILWDIAGQESFASMRPKFYRGSKAAIMVFSHAPDQEKSFDNLQKWLADLKKNAGSLPIALFGNKVDLGVGDGKRSDKNVEKYAKEQNFLGYFKTSALTGEGLNDAFDKLTETLYKAYQSFST